MNFQFTWSHRARACCLDQVFEYNDPVDGSVSKNQGGLRGPWRTVGAVRATSTNIFGPTCLMELQYYTYPKHASKDIGNLAGLCIAEALKQHCTVSLNC